MFCLQFPFSWVFTSRATTQNNFYIILNTASKYQKRSSYFYYPYSSLWNSFLYYYAWVVHRAFEKNFSQIWSLKINVFGRKILYGASLSGALEYGLRTSQKVSQLTFSFWNGKKWTLKIFILIHLEANSTSSIKATKQLLTQSMQANWILIS